MIFRNAIKTPDGTVLESQYQHDFRSHKDELTNNIYFVDGGREYFRRSANGDEKLLYVVGEEDDYNSAREYVTWGTVIKNELHPVLIKDLETDHIKNILSTYDYMLDPFLKKLMEHELKLRT